MNPQVETCFRFQYLQDPLKPENLTSAEIVFKQALKIDPNFGQAQAGLGQTYWLKYQLTKQKQWITPAQEACTKAVDLGNAGAEGHMCLGLLEDGTGQYEKAAEQFQHHPDIDIRWNKVTLALTTHDTGGLTEKDFALARRCDALVSS